MHARSRLKLIVLGILALAGPSTWAKEVPTKYAVLSLVGNEVTIVTEEKMTGSRQDQNSRTTVPMSNGALDNAALLAAEDAIKRVDPQAGVALFSPPWPSLFEEQHRFFVDERVALPEKVEQAIKGTGAAYLVLLTKDNDATKIRMVDGFVGVGKVQGIGFYLDYKRRLRNDDAHQSNRGYMASYAYVRMTLVDTRNFTRMAEKEIRGSSVFTASLSDTSMDPWDALSPESKAESLRALLAQEVGKWLPALLKGNVQ